MFTVSFLLFFFLGKGSNASKIVDLTWEFNNDTVYWPGQRPFSFTKQVASESDRGYWYSVNEFCAAEHGGTHFDAPYHFNKHGWTVSEIPVDRLITKGVVLKLRSESDQPGKDARLKVEDLEKWEKDNGPFENGSVLLVDFGRAKFWGENTTKYLELDSENKMNFPGISVEAANWITNSNKFYGVGLDTPSIDPGNSNDMMVHRIFARHQMYNLENVKMVTDLPDKDFTLIIAPMKIGEGTGAPVRIIALIKN